MNQDHPFHTLTSDEALAQLRSDREGLTIEEARERLAEYGPNQIEEQEQASRLALFLAQFRNPFVYVLIGAGIISLLGGHVTDAIVIVVIIFVNAIIGFVQEYQAEEALSALRDRAAPEATVRRVAQGRSRAVDIPAVDVVPGDILVLTAGDRVPADARLIEAANLSVDEAMLTGESVSADKRTEPVGEQVGMADRRNMVYAATAITRGRGLAVATGTGSHTEIGRIATMIQDTEKSESPIRQQMAQLGRWMSYLALAISGITFAIGLLRGFELQGIFMLALASAVSAIPEGLPAVVTITLAVGVNRMAKRHAIIRRLRAVDTLGAATVIVSDKTGTLTTNEMTVQRMYLDGRTITVTGAGWQPEGEFLHDGASVTDPLADRCLSRALEIGLLCNDSQLDWREGDSAVVQGDPTEAALIVAATKAGLERQALETRLPRIDEIPFDSQAAYMATFHDAEDSDQVLVYTKGAPERLLEMSCGIQTADGVVSLESREGDVTDASASMARDALRVLGLAFAQVPRDEVASFKERLQNGEPLLTFLALTGMMDPPRTEVPDSIAEARRAGIEVIMATGDHRETAEAVGREIGILTEGQQVLTGADVDAFDDQALDDTLAEARVFARVSPAHKHRLVESLQRLGHIVAMTGDGVNDAPALRGAQVGIAMGITGTDVTKEVADMVLTDDNFASIVSAIEEGRGVFQNLRKVVKFLLSTNFGEGITIITALLLFPVGQPIIAPVQILWVNLVTDGILDITIAMEPREDDVMDEPPRKPDTPLVNAEMVRNMLFVALFMAAGTLWSFSTAYGERSLAYAQTVAFTTLAMFQVFNSLNVRSRTKSVFRLGLFTNRWLLGAIIVSVILQVLSSQWSVLRMALGTEPLSLAVWLRIVALSSTVFIADEARKWFQRRRRAGSTQG